jgi:hypothetical protein
MNRSKRFRQAFAAWLLAGVHLQGVSFGEHSITMSPAGVGDVIRWSAAGPAPGALDFSMAAGGFGQTSGGFQAPAFDAAGASPVNFGGTNATTINIGSAGHPVVSIVAGASQWLATGTLTLQGSGITSLDSTGAGVTVGNTSATSVTLGRAGVAATAPGGLLSTGLDTIVAGTLNLGVTTATGVTAGKAGVALTAPGGLLTGTIDQIVAGSLNIGRVTATQMIFGSAGINILIPASIAQNAAFTSPATNYDNVNNGSIVDAVGNAVVGRFKNAVSGNNGALICQGGQNAAPGANITIVSIRRFDATEIGSIQQSGAATTAFTTTSDRRVKENIVDTTKGLVELLQLRVRDYNEKVSLGGSKKRVLQGFIAQELHEIYPLAVSVPRDPDEMWGVDYGRLTPLCVRAIQELEARVRKLEAA